MWWLLLFACIDEDPSALDCPAGGVWAMEISETALPTCQDVASRYETLLEASRFCTTDADCQILDEHCGTGLGGCYRAVNRCLDQGFLDEVADLWNTHSGECTGDAGVCDCAAPEGEPICDAGFCVES